MIPFGAFWILNPKPTTPNLLTVNFCLMKPPSSVKLFQFIHFPKTKCISQMQKWSFTPIYFPPSISTSLPTPPHCAIFQRDQRHLALNLLPHGKKDGVAATQKLKQQHQ